MASVCLLGLRYVMPWLPLVTAIAILVYFLFMAGFAVTVWWVCEVTGRRDK